jgi:hypothetical protein
MQVCSKLERAEGGRERSVSYAYLIVKRVSKKILVQKGSRGGSPLVTMISSVLRLVHSRYLS